MPRISHSLSQFTKQEVTTLFAQARRSIRHPGLDVLIAPALKPEFGRILVVAARKIGNAPQRNKIRRQFKAIFYENKLYELGYDCIVIVKKGATELSFDDLKKHLLRVIETAKPLAKTP